MKSKYWFYLLVASSTLLNGCDNADKKVAPPALAKAPAVMDPFKFHKLIEVSPGQDYDVLSWGRGTVKAGSFMILHSDSAAAKYTTTTGDLDGAIVDVYNSDMDLDGNPEILIQAKGKDSINYTNIYAFEFNNGKANKIDFPRLTKSQRKGYRGDDNFYIKDGILMREFPIFDGNSKDAKATGQKRLFQYGLRNNDFTIKQLSTDSAATTNSSKPTVNSTVKRDKTTRKHSETTQKHTETTKKSKKHTEEKTHKKRRRRHHQSDDDSE
jgi:hypothetical protein